MTTLSPTPGTATARAVRATVADTDATAWLRAAGVTKRYGSRTVLAGVDLAIARGSFVVLAGRNGAGKSTLLSCLAGTIRHEGTVRLGGRPLGRVTQGRVAYLPQRLRLPPAVTGQEVLRLFGALGRGGRAARLAALPDGFLPEMDTPVGHLSGGQAQRVALAAALTGDPDLILLDEPFANLDDAGRDAARSTLRAACDAGTTVILASPTALDLLSVAERVVLIEDGRLAFDGSPGGYAGRLEVVIWVASGETAPSVLAAIPHVLSVQADGAWAALTCHEDRSVDVLRHLDALGITGDRLRLGGPAADARFSVSPTNSQGGQP